MFQDPNDLRRLLDMGMSPDEIASITPDGANALVQLLQGQQMPQPNYNVAPMAPNTMRAEGGPDAGKVTSLDFAAKNLYDQSKQAFDQAKQPRQMRVVGSGNGTVVDLSPEPVQSVELDRTRPQIDIPGVGKAYYSKDGRGAYVLGPDGQPATKVMLGYDMQGSMALNKYMQDQAKTAAEIAHTQEQTRASQVNNPDLLSGGATGLDSNLTGDAFLKQLTPEIANEVKAIGDGKTPFNPRSQRQMNLSGLVLQYNPNWSATDFQQKQATVKDFSPGGKSGQVVQAINQALHHAATTADAIDSLDNSNILPGIVNAPINFVEQKFLGDTRQGNFSTAAMALSEELKKIYAGGGGGSLAELQSWQKSFDPNAGKAQQKSYLAQGMRLLQGAMESRQESYQRGMGAPADFGNLFSPQAMDALKKLKGQGYFGDAPTQATVGAAAPPVPQRQSLDAPPNPAQNVGKIMTDSSTGMRYRSDGRSWVKVQ
jgi:hypothetical protein